MPAASKTPAEQPARFWLTPECERVQRELLDLSDALRVAALEEYPDLAPSFRAAAAEFRRHLREHVADVEDPEGLYAAVVQSGPRLGRPIARLCSEHAALEGSVETLDALLRRFDPADPAAAHAVRRSAAALAALVRRHQESSCALARSACCGGPGPAGND